MRVVIMPVVLDGIAHGVEVLGYPKTRTISSITVCGAAVVPFWRGASAKDLLDTGRDREVDCRACIAEGRRE